MAQVRSGQKPQIDDEALPERFRNNPKVIVHRGSGTPFVHERWTKDGVDVLWLIGRTDDEDDEDDEGNGN